MAAYEKCRDRVEGPEKDGECATDADCVRAGCSSEVCVPRSASADVMTTCEILPCFRVLDDCTCREQRCTWTLGEAKALPPVKLPEPRKVE